jgi:hypothetical protein
MNPIVQQAVLTYLAKTNSAIHSGKRISLAKLTELLSTCPLAGACLDYPRPTPGTARKDGSPSDWPTPGRSIAKRKNFIQVWPSGIWATFADYYTYSILY